MNEEVLLVFTNMPDRAAAERMADQLIANHLAACVNILPECNSVYRWQGAVEHASEVPLLIKTTRAAFARLEAAMPDLHPYELPELIAVPVNVGLPAYLAWVAAETQPRNIE